MIEYFEKQLEGRRTITKDDLENLQSTPLYDKYKIGDRILVFMDQNLNNNEILFDVKIVIERTIDKLEKDYKFVRMGTNSIPVLEKKNE
jgi:hypothetical protein